MPGVKVCFQHLVLRDAEPSSSFCYEFTSEKQCSQSGNCKKGSDPISIPNNKSLPSVVCGSLEDLLSTPKEKHRRETETVTWSAVSFTCVYK